MPFINLTDLAPKELAPGYTARLVHSDHLTISHVSIDAGAPLPQHAHPHEQIANLIEGEFEMTIAGEARVLKAGMVAVIPPNVPHSGKAITKCCIVDVFCPVREDLRK
jgi:quercetin dioxygenase-like cupin family protein